MVFVNVETVAGPWVTRAVVRTWTVAYSEVAGEEEPSYEGAVAASDEETAVHYRRSFVSPNARITD